MATASGHVQETRNLVPIAQFIESKSENGILMTIEMFIDPSKLDEYVKIVTPVCKKMREYEDCMFCEVSCHPEDKGHVRILHGWTKDSAWIRDNIETQPWFGNYVKEIVSIRDPNRQRVVQHFDRIPTA